MSPEDFIKSAAVGVYPPVNKSAAEMPTRTPSAFEQIARAVTDLQIATERAEAMADHICGPEPLNKETREVPTVDAPGVAPRMSQIAEVCNHFRDRITEALNRIERCL